MISLMIIHNEFDDRDNCDDHDFDDHDYCDDLGHHANVNSPTQPSSHYFPSSHFDHHDKFDDRDFDNYAHGTLTQSMAPRVMVQK